MIFLNKHKTLIFLITILCINSFVVPGAYCLSPEIVISSDSLEDVFKDNPDEDKLLPNIFWQESTASGEMAKDLMKYGLKQMGYKAMIIDNFNENDISELMPPIAILNPESAKELGPMLRTLNPDIRIVIVSGYALSEAEIASMGGDYYLRKSYTIIDFVSFLMTLKQEIKQNPVNKNNNRFELPEWLDYAAESFDDHPRLYEQLGKKALEYKKRLLKRKSDGALFILKTRYQPREFDQMDFIWPQKNDPFREYAAFVLGRSMEANVCDVIVPGEKEAAALAAYIGALEGDIHLVRVANDYKLEDEQVCQKELRKAFTRNLVMAVLIRKYDFHQSNHAPVKDSDVPMMFDSDQSFHKNLIDMERFTLAFMENYFPGYRYNQVNAAQLTEFIDLAELARAVDFCENELNIGKVIDLADELEARKQIEIFLHLEYAEKQAKTLRQDMLALFDHIFRLDKGIQASMISNEQIRQALSLDKGLEIKQSGVVSDSGQDAVAQAI